MSASKWEKWVRSLSISILFGLALAPRAASADPTLEVVIGSDTRHFARDALLARADVVTVDVANDVAYGRAMSFRAVPLATLLAGLNPPVDSVIETAALDGFAAQLPLDLIINTDPAKAIAWLAIEPADKPWPPLPRKERERRPLLYPVDWGIGGDDPQRAMVVSGGDACEPSIASNTLTRPRRRSDIARYRSRYVPSKLCSSRKCLPCHTLNCAGYQHCRSRFKSAYEPDGLLNARHAAHADPRSEIRAHVARAADARLRARSNERSRD